MEHGKLSFANMETVREAGCASCYFCLSHFEAVNVDEWEYVNDSLGKTLLCPKCGIDSVVPGIIDAARLEEWGEWSFTGVSEFTGAE